MLHPAHTWLGETMTSPHLHLPVLTLRARQLDPRTGERSRRWADRVWKARRRGRDGWQGVLRAVPRKTMMTGTRRRAWTVSGRVRDRGREAQSVLVADLMDRARPARRVRSVTWPPRRRLPSLRFLRLPDRLMVENANSPRSLPMTSRPAASPDLGTVEPYQVRPLGRHSVCWARIWPRSEILPLPPPARPSTPTTRSCGAKPNVKRGNDGPRLGVESGSKRKLGVSGRTSLLRMAKAREGGPEVVRPRRRRVKELSRGSKSFTSEASSR
jgi:hypothetical protein